jgi:hypothetical protein
MVKVPGFAKPIAGRWRIVEWASGYVCESG